jgi:PilZ domain
MVGELENARAAERVKVEAFVKVSGGDHQEYVFRTRDLSTGGLFLYTRVAHVYPFKIGSTLMLELYDYDESVTCKVVVVRVVEHGSAESDRYPTGFGVRIVDCDSTNRARLDALLDRAKAGGDLV